MQMFQILKMSHSVLSFLCEFAPGQMQSNLATNLFSIKHINIENIQQLNTIYFDIQVISIFRW